MSDRNAFLAEHLFGLDGSVCIRCGQPSWDQAEHPPTTTGGTGHPFWPWPDYEHTWEGAGLVFEAMRERGYGISVSLSQWTEKAEAQVVNPRAAVGLHRRFTRYEPTGPQAVTAAACAALEAEVRDEA